MPIDRPQAADILQGWRECCAWLELQAEDLEAGDVRITCDGKDMTAAHAQNLRLLIRKLRERLARQDDHRQQG